MTSTTIPVARASTSATLAQARPLTKAGVNLKYFYAFIEPNSDKAMAVLKTDDIDKAEKVLESE